MAGQDSLELIKRDFDALLARAVKIGEERAVAKVMAVIRSEEPAKPAQPNLFRGVVTKGQQPKRTEYGTVKPVVQEALRRHASTGVTPSQLHAELSAAGANITLDQVKNAIKVMKRKNEAQSRDGKVFPL